MSKKILASVLAACILAGCGTSHMLPGDRQYQETAAEADPKESTPAENPGIILTDKQKEILALGGLSTEYEELTSSQKSSILAIGQMFDYAEQKYGCTFEYLGYYPNSMMEREHIECYEAGTSSDMVVTFTRVYEDNQFVYTDDYEEVKASVWYEEALTEELSDKFEAGSYFVVSKVSELLEGAEPSNILGKAHAVSDIYISENQMTKEEFEKIVSETSESLAEKYIGAATYNTWNLMKGEAFEKMNSSNYVDYLSGNIVLQKDVYIRPNGVISYSGS